MDLAILVDLVARGHIVPHIGWFGDWERTPDTIEAMTTRRFVAKAVVAIDRDIPALRPA